MPENFLFYNERVGKNYFLDGNRKKLSLFDKIVKSWCTWILMMWSFVTIQWSKQKKEDIDLQDKFEDTKGVTRNHK